ncbi:MAG: endonuclease/exonuclease/phosphatase family protein [Bacteroidaceae bacterium]
MRKYLLFLFLFSAIVVTAQNKKMAVYPIAFYNLENLFDTIHQPGVYDEEFTPSGGMRWTGMKYKNKLKNMSYAISQFATDGPFPCPQGPVIIGISEIENLGVVEDLIHTGKLAERNYGIVHYDSPDRRGIDVGLIYDRDRFTLESSQSVRLVYPADTSMKTRDQLVVSGMLAGERVHVIVNHYPSRLGGEKKSRPKREAAAALSKHIADSIVAADPNSKVIIMGDLNDDPSNTSCCEVIGAVKDQKDVKPNGYFNPLWKYLDKGIGSLAYQGQWNLFDQIIVTGNLVGKDRSTLKYVKSEIFNRDFLKQQEGKYKGYPLRTHAGGVYMNGYSDHFPTIIYLAKEVK